MVQVARERAASARRIPAVADLTIDELAREAGMTVRNVRSHQTRGLLPGPEVRGRVGFYGEEHLERLRLIQELQQDGLPLRLVERLLTNRADAAGRLMALRRTVISPLQQQGEVVTITVDEVIERFGRFDQELFEQATELGALIPQADGTFLVPLPGLLDTAEAAMAQGVSLKAALKVAQAVRANCEDAARTFVDLILDEVWEPFTAAGRPDAQWPQIASSIDHIRPLATEIFMQLLPPAIAEEIERAFGEELREQAEAE